MKILYGLEGLPHGFPYPVATVGNFDGVHLGHQRLMRDLTARAAKVGGTPAVITFQPHPLQVLAPNNAPRMLQTMDQRQAALASLGISLAIVLKFDMELARVSARDFGIDILWRKMNLQEIYVGPNFAFGHRREGSFNLLKELGEENGFLVGKIPQIQFRGSRVSSTAIRQGLMMGQAGLARRLLGRPYALDGEVVRGNAVGTGIRVPTANMRSVNELVPRRGVYVTVMTIDGEKHRGVTNIGVRPTIAAGQAPPAPSIETHLLDFEQDIYGKPVSLEFLHRLRDERRFPGTDALVAQIRGDIARARRYFRWMDSVAAASGSNAGPAR
ncbi:MAG: riboflavin biosynthesis protein RibF [Acidobacteria bacterium]|nr:riboflavin biosynthesis protein RibF [Acidobacteriota bacterium]